MKRILFALALILCVLFIFAQEKEKQNPKEIFLEAESYLLYEEYTEALPLYLKLSKAGPDNDNLNFKVGLCYLNIPYEKERAISYLEKASKNINPNYKPNNFKENKAPLDALFYLGNAYRVNNQLEKALETYYSFKKQIDPEIYDEVIVDEQVAAIERAKRYQTKPIKFEPKNIGEPVNSKFAETNAVVSADENTLVYNVKLQFYDALFYSVKESNNQWSVPVNIIPELGVDGDVYATCLSSNGKELYIYRSDNFDGNIYVSRYVNERWTPIKRLNENVNTKFWESHASISADGKTLYFSSNRKGGYGGLDVYFSQRDDINSDNWQRAQNMGPQINTSYNEETPFIADDGTTLFFSSYGHFNMGGYDIFYSNLLENGKWSAPLNMGYPLNTTDDDVFFVPVKGGKFAYMSRYYPESFGRTDIYRVEIHSEQHPRKFILKGLLSLPPGIESNASLMAYIINKSSRDTVQIIPIDPKKAKFDSRLFAGNYQLVIAGNGLERSVQDFSIDKNQNSDELTIRTNMKSLDVVAPVQQASNEPVKAELQFSQKIIKVNSGDPVLIPLDLPVGSKVDLVVSVDSIVTHNESFVISKKNTSYSYKPLVGTNILKFSALTPSNVLKEGIVFIIYEEKKDSISPVNIAQMQYARMLLQGMASKNLSGRIQLTADESEQLSLNEYAQLLKSFAAIDSFSPGEVDSLLTLFLLNQPLAAQLFIGALKELASPELAKNIDNVTGNRKFANIFDAVEAILENKEIQGKKLELVSISSKLADNGNVYYYLDALRKVAPDNMKTALMGINLQKEKIQTPEELLDYLYKIQPESGFSTNDIYESVFAIPTFTSPAAFVILMANVASEPMFNFLNTVFDGKKIENNKELGKLLRKLAADHKISDREILNTFIRAASAHYYNAYKDNLGLFANGQVRDILNKFTLEEAKADSTNELLNWLLRHSDSDILKNDLIRTFAQIASKNLLKAHQIEKTNDNKSLSILNISVVAAFTTLFLLLILNIIRKRKEEK